MGKTLNVTENITNLELEWFVQQSKSFTDLCVKLGCTQLNRNIKKKVLELEIDLSHFTKNRIQAAIKENKKYCTKCETTLPLENFSRNRLFEDGRSKYCLDCFNENHKRWMANSIKARATKKNNHLKYNFGITLDDYNEIFLSQAGVCAICFKPETQTWKQHIKTLAVDHCHTTDKIRGLLCYSCNTALGQFKDDVNLLKNAIEYLIRSRS